MERWNLIFVGIQLCLAVQLAVVGLLNFFTGKGRNFFLGAYCLLVAQTPLILAFPTELKSSTLGIIFIWAWKGFFYGPLLYLFIASLNQERTRTHYISHLIVPFILYCSSLYKELFIEGGTLAATVLNNIKYYSYWGIIVIYFYLGLVEFKKYLKDKLEIRSRTRFYGFYVIVNVHLLSSIIPGLIRVLSKHSSVAFIDDLNESFATPFYNYYVIPFYILLFIVLIYFGITELGWVKKHFSRRQIYQDTRLESMKIDSIKQIMDKAIEGDAFFRSSKVGINDVANLTGLSKKAIRYYLLECGYKTFTEFINHLRIEEVKKKLSENINSNYDFVSLAKESGFESKATFYRVFKQLTNKTPSSFINTNE